MSSMNGKTLIPTRSPDSKDAIIMMGGEALGKSKTKKATSMVKSKSNDLLEQEPEQPMRQIDEQSEPVSVGDRHDMPTANAVTVNNNAKNLGPAENSIGSINDEAPVDELKE